MGNQRFFHCVAVKEVLEYTRNINQLRRWYQELLGYNFAIIHHVTSMMIDVYGLSRHINIIIHHYITQASRMRVVDVIQRLFVYSYNNFNNCANPRHSTTSDTTVTIEGSSLLPSFFIIIHHSPINFTSTPISQSCSAHSPKPHNFHHVVPPEVIIWLLFDTVTTSFDSLSLSLVEGSVTNFPFEMDPKYYHISFFFSSSTPSTYTTLSNLLHHL